MLRSLVGSEMCIRDRYHGVLTPPDQTLELAPACMWYWAWAGQSMPSADTCNPASWPSFVTNAMQGKLCVASIVDLIGCTNLEGVDTGPFLQRFKDAGCAGYMIVSGCCAALSVQWTSFYEAQGVDDFIV